MTKKSDFKLISLRKTAIFGTVISTVCLVSIVIVLPIIHVSFQEKISIMLLDVEACRVR